MFKPPCVFIDATTIHLEHSGTGVYSQNLLDYYCRREDISLLVGVRESSAIKVPQSTVRGITPSLNATYILLSEQPHVALNIQLLGNRIRSRASAGIFPNYFIPPGWPTPAAATIHDVSFITHPQFYSQKMRLWYSNRIRHTVKHASIILTVSESSKKSIIEHLGVSADRIMVHPPMPADLRISDITSNPHPRPYLIYIGNLEPKKNIEHILLAFEQSKLNTMDFVIVGKFHAGTSRWRRRIQQIIESNPHIHYTGFLSDTLRNAYLLHAVGLIHCTHVEGFGISLLNALQYKIPTIISRDAALQEVAGGHSTVVDETDISAIAQGMIDLIGKSSSMVMSGINTSVPQTTEIEVEPTILINTTKITSMYYRLEMARQHAYETYGVEAYSNRLDAITDRLLFQQRRLFAVKSADVQTNQHAVVASMAYSFIFSETANLDKLYNSLPLRSMTRVEFNHVLVNLLKTMSSIIQRRGSSIHLNCTESNLSTAKFDALKSPTDFKAARVTITSPEKLRRDNKRVIRLLSMLPWIKAVYYSGGTAHQNFDPKHGDLDLFIVAARNRVWLAWLCTRLLGGSGTRLCSNYFVDEDAQEITWQPDFYTAHQLLFLRQVIRKTGVPHVREMNSIVKHYFPNSPSFKNTQQVRAKTTTGSFFGTLVNACVFAVVSIRWSTLHRRSATGGMLWDLHRIKLHTNDHRQRIYKKFDQQLHQFNTVLAGRRNAVHIRSKPTAQI